LRKCLLKNGIRGIKSKKMWVRTVAWEVLTRVFYISMLLMGPENGILRQVLTGKKLDPNRGFLLKKKNA